MAEAAPPVGYQVVTDGDGVWPTNIVDDATQYKTGDRSVKFTGNPTGTYLFLGNSVLMPCAPGDLLRVGGWVRSAEKTGDDVAVLRINWYTAADAYDSNSTIHGAELGAATTWEYKQAIVTAPATAYKWRVLFGKNPGAEDIWWDSVFVEAVAVGFLAYLSADQALTTGGEYVVFDAEIYDYGSNYNVATGEFTVPVDGTYLINATVQCELLDTGEIFYLGATRISGMTTTRYLYSPMVSAPADNASMPTQVNGFMSLLAGDVVKIWAVHDHGSDLNATGADLSAGNFASSFAMALVR